MAIAWDSVLRLVISLVAFLFTITILILFHEFGHLVVAKLVRIRVVRFSFGFGKRLLKFKPKETEYALSAVPLGGYVKMAGDTPEEIKNPKPGDYYSVGPLKRILVILAGPLMSLILAYIIFVVVGLVGYTEYFHEPLVGEVRQTLTVDGQEVPSPASQIGLMPQDRFVEVDGVPINDWVDVVAQIYPSAGEEIALTMERDGEELDFQVTPVVADGSDVAIIGIVGYQGNVVSMVVPGSAAYRAGLEKGDVISAVNGEPTPDYLLMSELLSRQTGEMELTVQRGAEELTLTMEAPGEGGAVSFGFVCGLKERQVSEPFPQVMLSSAKVTTAVVVLTAVGIYQIVTGRIPVREAIGGPITMADFAGQTAMAGWQTLLRYVALLSIFLFILNLLPIPVLDGGNILLSIVELIKGSPVSFSFRVVFQQVGLFIVLGIMGFAIIMDVIRYAT